MGSGGPKNQGDSQVDSTGADLGNYWVNVRNGWKIPERSRGSFFTYAGGNCVAEVNELKFDAGTPIYWRYDPLFVAKNSGSCWWEFTTANFTVVAGDAERHEVAEHHGPTVLRGNNYQVYCQGGNLPCKTSGATTRTWSSASRG